MIITQEYFDDVNAAVNSLKGFTDDLAKDPVFGNAFNELVKGEIRNGESILVRAEDKIPVMALADLVRCYHWLKRGADTLYKPEGLAILLYIFHLRSSADIRVFQ